MKRTMMTAALAALTMMVALPGAAKSDRLEVVEGSVVADKGGQDADTELDFARLEVVSTAENLELHIQTYTAWADLPEPLHARLAVKVAQPGWKTFYPNVYTVSMEEDGSVSTGTDSVGGANVNSKKSKAWEGNGDLVQAELDATDIVVTIPWADLPAEEIWLQVCAQHLAETEDEAAEETEEEATEETDEAVTKAHETGAEPEAEAEVEAEVEEEKGKKKKKKGDSEDEEDAEPSFVDGASAGVPSDYIPNFWKAIAASKP
jgi:hypothetical protein